MVRKGKFDIMRKSWKSGQAHHPIQRAHRIISIIIVFMYTMLSDFSPGPWLTEGEAIIPPVRQMQCEMDGWTGKCGGWAWGDEGGERGRKLKESSSVVTLHPHE